MTTNLGGSTFTGGQGEQHFGGNKKMLVKKKLKEMIQKEISNKKSINEASYKDFRKNEGSPKQKIGTAIKEIKKQITEVERRISHCIKLKEEMGVNSGSYWNSTSKYLSNLSEKLNHLSINIKNLSA